MAGQQEAILFLGNIYVYNLPVCGIFDNGIYRFDLFGDGDGSSQSIGFIHSVPLRNTVGICYFVFSA